MPLEPQPAGKAQPAAGASADGRAIELRVEDLHKSFDEKAVLRGIDLGIDRGDFVAVVGDSGCGKTVLLELMTGQMAPDRGRVLLANHQAEGTPLVDLALLDEDGLRDVRLHWAIVFQRNALFSGTVYENIALWLTEVKRLGEAEILRRAQAALAAVDLDPGVVLDMSREDLSGGMAKRVAIARALAMDPMLIFYDEPTTGLDPRHAGHIHELLAQTHWRAPEGTEKRTSVVITHDKDLLRRIEPRVVMIHEGRVLFDGDYQSFARSRSRVVRPYFDSMPLLQRRAARM